MDFSKIEVDGKLLGVLNFNLMIPIEEAQLQPIDLIVRRRDRSEIIRYKELCQKELEWCHRHREVIRNKANVLYKAYISDDTFSARDRSDGGRAEDHDDALVHFRSAAHAGG